MRRVFVVAFLVTVALALAAPATAAPKPGTPGPRGNVVVFDGRTEVAEGDVVNSVVVFHGRTVIAGSARGSVVVFDGTTTISGDVRGTVIVFRGHVDVTSTAHIGGDLVTHEAPHVAPGARIDGKRRNVSNISFTGYSWTFHLLVWLAYSVSVLILGLIMMALLPGPMESAALAARSIGATIGWGFVMLLGLPIAAVVVMLTLVGIPLGLALLLALWFLFTVGYTVGAFAIGRMLVKPPRGRFKAFFAGWGIGRVAALLPILAGLAWTALAVIGLGAMCVAAWRSRRAVRAAEREPLPPSPAAAPLSPAPPPAGV